MGLCKDCKWWGVDYDNVCDYVETIQCDNNKVSAMSIKVSVLDDSGLDANLVTMPCFGCVNFKSEQK